jgi:hypothetical protein
MKLSILIAFFAAIIFVAQVPACVGCYNYAEVQTAVYYNQPTYAYGYNNYYNYGYNYGYTNYYNQPTYAYGYQSYNSYSYPYYAPQQCYGYACSYNSYSYPFTYHHPRGNYFYASINF